MTNLSEQLNQIRNQAVKILHENLPPEIMPFILTMDTTILCTIADNIEKNKLNK